MLSGTRNPKTRRVNPTFKATRTRPEPVGSAPEPDPKPDIQNPKTRDIFGFQKLGQNTKKYHQNQQKNLKMQNFLKNLHNRYFPP